MPSCPTLNWLPENARVLFRKSYEGLPRGGRFIIHEMLFNAALLSDAGFTEIEVKPSFGYWSLVTARKRSSRLSFPDSHARAAVPGPGCTRVPATLCQRVRSR
jgi:hypothetical protein